MGEVRAVRFAVVLHILVLIPGALSWGREGHHAICQIAEGFLTSSALSATQQLLPEYADGDLAAVCSWADDIKHDHHMQWSSALHYVDTPDFSCNYNYDRDCHDFGGRKDRCVSGGIHNYTGQLASSFASSDSVTKYNLTEALMFLSHFVGDIHQPLHAGFTGDRGGNSILVHWYGRKARLHYVWDDLIIDSGIKRFYGSELSTMVETIRKNINDSWSSEVPEWGECASNIIACPDTYASESVDLACKYAYRNATPGSHLEDDYFVSRFPIVEKRLAQAGVRLGYTLNRIFTPPLLVDDEEASAAEM